MPQRTGGSRLGRWRTGFEITTTVMMLGLAAILVWQGWGRGAGGASGAENGRFELPSEAVPIGERPTLGSAEAKVVMIEYSDFECPFCAKFATETMPVLVDEFVETGQVQLVFKQLPLRTIHSRAEASAIASVCAWRQGRFWSMHDGVFRQPEQLSDTDLEAIARRIGLDVIQFRACTTDTKTRAIVDADIAEAERLRITGTPSFLLGRREGHAVRVVEFLRGARSVQEFRPAIERLLLPERRTLEETGGPVS